MSKEQLAFIRKMRFFSGVKLTSISISYHTQALDATATTVPRPITHQATAPTTTPPPTPLASSRLPLGCYLLQHPHSEAFC